MIIAVTGATGYVGRFVVNELLSRGYLVRALARDDSDTSGFATSPQWIFNDVRSFVSGAEILVHCAFAHEPGRYRGGEGSDPIGFWQANHQQTVGLYHEAQKVGVRRVVFLSSRAVYGGDLPEYLDEDYPVHPDTHYGALKVAAESLSHVFPGMEFVSLRSTGVFGVSHPVSRSKWFDLVAASGAGEPVASYRAGTEVHGADLADAVIRLFEAPEGTYNCSDLVVSTTDVLNILRLDFVVPPAPLEESSQPRGIMRCPRLSALGWSPVGKQRVVDTVRMLGEQAGLKRR